MKRTVLISALALAMALCFAGCSGEGSAKPIPSSTTEAAASASESNSEPTGPVETPSEARDAPAEGAYPAAWQGLETIALADFNQVLKAENGSFQGFSDDMFGWHNNTIAVELCRAEGTGVCGLKVVYAAAKNDEAVTWENVSDTRFTVNDIGKTLSVPLAKWLWDVMGELKTAITVAEANGLSAPTSTTTAEAPAQADEPAGPVEAGGYPFSDEWVTLDNFTQALANSDSNFTRMGTAPAWSNGYLAISFYLPASDPVSGPEEYHLRMWVLANEQEVETIYLPIMGASKTVDKQSRMSLALAKDVWDFTQFCDGASTHEDIKTFVAAQRGQTSGNSGQASSMTIGEYPFSGEQVSESDFNKALKAKNSSWSPCQPYGGDSFAWSNGALILQPYNTGSPDYDGSDQYGMYVYLYGAPDGQSVRRSRSSSSGPCTITDGDVSIGMAELLWDFMAAFEQSTTMEEVFANKDYRGNFFYEDGYSK